MKTTIRPISERDVEASGAICYEAFRGIAQRHGFTPDFPSVEVATGLLANLTEHPGFYGVVAERGGEVVGSNFVDDRGPVGGIGPVTVAQEFQNGGIGRLLMKHLIARAESRGNAPLRLTQAAYHARSLSLYAKLGFDTRESLCVMQGSIPREMPTGRKTRPFAAGDQAACSALCRRVHGHDRDGELADALQQGTARVVEHQGRITGYASMLGYFGHAVAESNEDLKALIASTDAIRGPGFMLPARNGELMRWCLDSGLEIVHVATLMTRGNYQEPNGVFLPSILY